MPDVPITYQIDPDATMLLARTPRTNCYVTDVVTGDATQQLAIAGRPTGDAVTLSYGGQTTPPMPTIPSDPFAFFEWNATVTAGTYRFYTNIFMGGSASAVHTYEVRDATTPLGTMVLDHQTLSNNTLGFVTDPALVRRGDSVPIQRWLLGTFTLPTGDLHVRVSCPAGGPNNTLDADNLWVVTTGGADVLRVQPAIPPATYGTGLLPYSSNPQGYQPLGQTPNMFITQGTGVGTRYLLDPALAQSRMEALSSVGTGNMTVSGNGDPLTPMRFRFQGALGAVAQPHLTFTPTDGTISVTDFALGGSLPIVKRNGTVVPISRDYLCYKVASRNLRDAWFAWPQPLHVSLKYAVPWQHENDLSGSWLTFQDGGSTYHAGYSEQTYRATGIGPFATYLFRMTPQGVYRVSVAHPVDAAYSTDVVYTVRDVDGNVLGTYHVDQTVAPAGAVDAGVPWTVLGTFTLGRSVGGKHMNGLVVTQTNATGSMMVADAVRFEQISLAQPTVHFDPSDVVTVTAGRGWLTCSDGPAEAVTDATVQNLSGGELFATDNSPTVMEMGYNVPEAKLLAPSIYLNRLLHGPMVRYPTTLGSPSGGVEVATGATTFAGDRRSPAPVLPGDWDLLWREATAPLASHLALVSPIQGGAVEVSGRAIFPGVDAHGRHRRTFTMAGDAFNYGPEISLLIPTTDPSVTTAPWPCDLDDAWIVEKDTDVTTASRWHPDFVSRVTGLKTLRWLDALGAIEGNVVDFSDLTDAGSGTSRSTIPNVLSIDLATCTISDYTYSSSDFAHDFDRTEGAAVVFTFSSPHGLRLDKRGLIFDMEGYTGSLAHIHRADDGATVDFQVAASHPLFAWPISTTKIVARIGNASGGVGHGGEQRMANVISDAGGRFVLRFGSPVPIGDVVDACNMAGANLYFNLCLQASDACIDAAAAYIAAHLAPGLIVRWEPGNEPWNFTNSVNTHLKLRNNLDFGAGSGDFITAYCEIARNQFVRAKAGWVAAGRDPAHLRSTMGGQMFGSGYSRQYAAYFAAKGWAPFDTLAVADYMGNDVSAAAPNAGVRETSFREVIDSMSPGQHVTAFILHRLDGGYESEVPGHKAALVEGGGSGYAGAEVGYYEGGFDILLLQGRDGDNPGPYPCPNKGYFNHAMQRHRRMYHANRLAFRTGEVSGASFQNVFMLQGSDNPDYVSWGTFRSAGQLPYSPGDPTQDAIQLDQVDNQALIRSIAGGAVRDQAALFAGLAPPAPTPVVIQNIAAFRNLRAG